MKKHILYLVALGFVVLCVTSAHGVATLTVHNATSNEAEMAKINEYTKNIMTKDGAYKLVTPITQPSVQMTTLDGQTSFQADITCSTEATLIKLSALPSSSLAGSGELNIAISYDYNFDGSLDHMFVINNVGGACVNGAIVECNPAGSWQNCKYGLMEFDSSGVMSLPTELSSGIPRPPHGMLGCFCFNASCGQNTLQKLENILLTLGTGVLNLMRQRVPDLLVSRTQYDFETMTYSFFGTKSIHCSSLDNELVRDRTNMYGELFFPYQQEMLAQEAIEDSPWNLIKEHAIKKVQEYTCTNRAAVSFEQVYANEWVTLDFGIGLDSDGSSPQCYTFISGSCGPSYFETHSTSECYNWIAANRLGDVCSSAYLTSGYFSQIVDVRNLQATSGWGNYIGCYGSDGNPSDIWNTVECAGRKLSFMPTCMSPSMGKEGQILVNDPYDKNVYQGCYKVAPYQNGCAELAARDDCRVVDRLRDGFYVVRDGISTSQQPPVSCRVLTAPNRTVTICEPWWDEKVVYECDQEKEGWEKEKLRTQAITEGINFSNGQWISQGDIGFNEDGSTYTKNILADIAFQNTSDKCIPACLVTQTYKSDQIYLPEQGKLDLDGKYHLDQHEASYISQGTVSVPEVKECINQNGKYVCPVGEYQSIQYDCTCSNAQEFVAAIVSLTAISQAASDFICSTGEQHGQCISTTEEDPANYRVVCNKVEGLMECSPYLWTANAIPPQTHSLSINNQYQCVALGVLENEDDFTFTALKPESEWFDPKMDWAKGKIREYIVDNSLDVNSLEGNTECGCAGFDHSIKVCQPKSDGNFQCITSNAIYDSEEVCEGNCNGRATYSSEAGLCIFKEPELGLGSAGLAATYNLALAPESEKVFGEIIFAGNLLESIFQSSSFAYCEDNTFYDQVVNTTASANCTANYSATLAGVGGWESDPINVFQPYNSYLWTLPSSYKNLSKVSVPSSVLQTHVYGEIGSSQPLAEQYYENDAGTVLYKVTYTTTQHTDESGYLYRKILTYYINSYCPLTGVASVITPSECTQQCNKSEMRCESTGQLVYHPNDCIQYDYQCSSNGTSYGSMSSCASNCSGILGAAASCLDTSNYDNSETTTQSANCVANYSATLVGVGGWESEAVSIYQPGNSSLYTLPSSYRNLSKVSVPSSASQMHVFGEIGNRIIEEERYYENDAGTVLYKVTYALTQYAEDWGYLHRKILTFNINSYCPLTGVVSAITPSECTQQCSKTEIRCKSTGQLVSHPNDCIDYQYDCPTNGLTYDSMSTCLSSCTVESVQGLKACSSVEGNPSQHKFSYYLTPTSGQFGLEAVVSYVPAQGNEEQLARTSYENEHTILGQCSLNYLSPYIDYDEPGTNAHFEFSYADQKIFNYAAASGILPKAETANTLPLIPPVYSGSVARELQIWDNRNADSIEMGDGPLPLNARIRELLTNKAATAPRIPMFWDKEVSSAYDPDTSTRLGVYNLALSKLTPRVYYYECPDITKTAGDAPSCGHDGIFGGIAQTIAGPYCFQYHCDGNAITEETTENLSGCGMINDGRME